MVGCGLPRPWSEGDEPGRCPWARSPVSFLGKERSLDKDEERVLEGSLILLGINSLRAADCDLADQTFSTTELTASPNSPVCEMGEKTFSFSRISVRLSHK